MLIRNRLLQRSAILAASFTLAVQFMPALASAQPGAADPQVAAIQAVITQANQEQAQALASGDPSGMSDTATAAHFRELVQINQSLTADGVIGIELTQLTWGSIQVTGATASATTTETSITTFDDGTTLQSTDSNVYALVNQDGMWLIANDSHPSATPAQSTVPPTPQAPVPVPMVPAGQHTSHNWAGYAVTNGVYTGVTGTWTVPQPNVLGGPGVGATWVGIGGVSSLDLIQAGTQDATAGGGQAQFRSVDRNAAAGLTASAARGRAG